MLMLMFAMGVPAPYYKRIRVKNRRAHAPYMPARSAVRRSLARPSAHLIFSARAGRRVLCYYYGYVHNTRAYTSRYLVHAVYTCARGEATHTCEPRTSVPKGNGRARARAMPKPLGGAVRGDDDGGGFPPARRHNISHG